MIGQKYLLYIAMVHNIWVIVKILFNIKIKSFILEEVKM